MFVCVLEFSDQNGRCGERRGLTEDHGDGPKTILPKTDFSNQEKEHVSRVSFFFFNYETLTKPNNVEVNSTSEGHDSTEHSMFQLIIKRKPSSVCTQAPRHTSEQSWYPKALPPSSLSP